MTESAHDRKPPSSFPIHIRFDQFDIDIRLRIRHPDSLAEDLRLNHQEATKLGMKVADILGTIVNDEDYLDQLRPHVYRQYYEMRTRSSPFNASELLSVQKDNFVPSELVFALHEHRCLSDNFLAENWRGAEAEALELFSTLDKYLPHDWLDHARKAHVPDLKRALVTREAVGPISQAVLQSRSESNTRKLQG